MKNFNNTFNEKRGGDFRKRDFRRGGGGGRQSGNRDRERPQMHEAICSDCGKKCEVPFKPTSYKPVYCSQCFSSRRENSSSDRPERRSYERPRFQDKKMFDATCDKCGKKFELPFRPTGSKPVYCNECFDRGGTSVNKNNDNAVDEYKKQFDMLNNKLDRIISALTPVAPAKEQRKDVIVRKKKPVKKKVKAKKPQKSADKKKKAKKDKNP